MADAAISTVLIKLGEIAASEIRSQLHVVDDIRLLRDRLEWLQAFVRDADRKRRAGTDALTRVWVQQTRNVAFEVEDALDDYFYEEVNGPKDQGYRRRWKAKGRYIIGLFTNVLARHGLAGRIEMIKSRLDQISVNQKEYQIVYTPSVVLASSTTAIAAWRGDLENAMGFDQDVEILKKMLGRYEQDDKHPMFNPTCGESSVVKEKHPMFISIVGESGAGKNTLAKIIRREMMPEMKFFVWYHMKPGSSTVDLLSAVYWRAYSQLHEWQPEEAVGSYDIGAKLRELLYGVRYLLILSGISSKYILNCLRAGLPDPDDDNNDGGRVMFILDTENEEIAWHANTFNRNGINGVHMLSRLDRKRSGELFLWKVLRKSQEGINRLSSQEDDGRYEEVVYRITGGYPMAIVLLAGLLRFKEKPVQWEAVLQQLESVYPPALDKYAGYRGSSQETNYMCNVRAIDVIFWTSFEDLPNDLKSCFLHFAAYTNDTCQYADEIVRIWIGEGFMKPQSKKTMEEVGHDYLKELVLRCLVEVEEMKPGGGILLVKVHNCIKGFLKSEVRESGFMEIHDMDDVDGVPVSPSTRRLSVQGNSARLTFTNTKFHQLRSFICHITKNKEDRDDNQHDLDLLCCSRFIRVISVQGLRFRHLPDQLCDLIHLRYLRIDCSDLRQLPNDIGGLLNLHTLDISNTKVCTIDMGIWWIESLRHVIATDLILPVSGGGWKLQTLHGVKPVHEAWTALDCPLEAMTCLQSLEMHGFKHELHDTPAFKAALGNMPLLVHLNLKGNKISSRVFTDPSLRHLQTMVLHGNVNWDEIISELPMVGRPLGMVRPNLVQLRMNGDAITGMPKSIKEQLEGILIEEENAWGVMNIDNETEAESEAESESDL